MRIQVLNLPDEYVDGQFVNRFALIVDEAPEVADAADRKQIGEDWNTFAREIGGKGAFVTRARLDIEEHTATAEMVTEIVHQLDELIGRRLDEHTAARNEIHYHHTAAGTNVEVLRGLVERQRRERGW